MTRRTHIFFVIIISIALTILAPAAFPSYRASYATHDDEISCADAIRYLTERMVEFGDIDHTNAAHKIMRQAATDSISFHTCLDMAEKAYGNPDSPQHDDSKLIPFLEEALRLPVLNRSEKERIGFLLEMARKNRPGTKAADFAFDNRDGDAGTLHGLPTDRRILLIFYDPDCNHCHETFDKIIHTEFPEPIRIVAIDAEYDRMLWEASASLLPAEWTVGFAADPVQDEDIYILTTMPTLYLLDRDKTVILKDTTLPHIMSELNPAE